MFNLTYGAASPIEGVDEGGIGITLLVDLETQVNAEDVMELTHFAFVHWQVDNGRHIE